jgi:hypothetical protein
LLLSELCQGKQKKEWSFNIQKKLEIANKIMKLEQDVKVFKLSKGCARAKQRLS